METSKVVKIIGFAATAIGVVATLLSEWANEKKMDQKIEEAVNEALTTKENKDEGES